MSKFFHEVSSPCNTDFYALGKGLNGCFWTTEAVTNTSIQYNGSREKKEVTGQEQFYRKKFRSRNRLAINFLYLPLNFFQLSPKKVGRGFWLESLQALIQFWEYDQSQIPTFCFLYFPYFTDARAFLFTWVFLPLTLLKSTGGDL